MLTMLRVPPGGVGGSETTEEIVRVGYPYYYKKNNGRMVMARKIPSKKDNKNFSLLGQAFGIDEPKRRLSAEASRKKQKKKPVQYLPQPQPPFSASISQQPFPGYLPPFAPAIPQQPFPAPNAFVPPNSGFTPFYPMPGFPPPPVPPPVPEPPQPMRWAFQQKAPKPPTVDELLKVESDYHKRAKSKSRRRSKERNDHTEIKTTTTTVVTKHKCIRCKRNRSWKYHLDNPIKAGETPTPGFCRRCRRNATSTSGSSSDDNNDGGASRHVDMERSREGRRGSKKKSKHQTTSRVHSVELLSRDDRSGNDRSRDYRDEIIVEEEPVHERKAVPKSQPRRSDNSSKTSVAKIYTRTREGDLASASRSYTRTREGDRASASRGHARIIDEDFVDDNTSLAGESRVKINITNRSASTTPLSSITETRDRSVRATQSTQRSRFSQTASVQDIRDGFGYVEPLRFVTSHGAKPKSSRASKHSLPSLHTRDHAQRRRSERANPEQTYDHATREKVYESAPRRRPDEDIIVVETEHEPPRSRTQQRTQSRTQPLSSNEDVIVVETEHEYPRSRPPQRTQPPPQPHSSEEDIIVVETEHEYPRSRTQQNAQYHSRSRSSDEDIVVVETEHEFSRSRPQPSAQSHPPPRRHLSGEDSLVAENEHGIPRFRTEPKNQPYPQPRPQSRPGPRPQPRSRSSDEDVIVVQTEHEHPGFRTKTRNETRQQQRLYSPVRTPIRTRETYATSEIDQYGNKRQVKVITTSLSSSSSRDFAPGVRHISNSTIRPSRGAFHHSTNVRHSSDSSEEYNRAVTMAFHDVPAPRQRHHPASSFGSFGDFMDGTSTPPQAPDPPTRNGAWEPRNMRGFARGTRRRARDDSNYQNYAHRVPQHPSTPRRFDQPWMDASSIDERRNARRNQNYQAASNRRPSESPVSSGSKSTQTDSYQTASPSISPPEVDSSPTVQSRTPRPVSVRDTTDSGNEVESTIDTPSSKAIAKKPADASSHRPQGGSEATKSNTKGKGHSTDPASQKYKDQLGDFQSYMNRTQTAGRPKDNTVTDGENLIIIDDASDLTLRTARSKADAQARKNAPQVTFAQNPEFQPTPEQYREHSWRHSTNNSAEQSWDTNTNADISWGPQANVEETWDGNADNAETSWGETTNANTSWEANNNEDNFWGPDTTETVLPDLGGYSGLHKANASDLDFSENKANVHGFDINKGFSKAKSGTGADGNDDDDGEKSRKTDSGEWGPVPTFSSLGI